MAVGEVLGDRGRNGGGTPKEQAGTVGSNTVRARA